MSVQNNTEDSVVDVRTADTVIFVFKTRHYLLKPVKA